MLSKPQAVQSRVLPTIHGLEELEARLEKELDEIETRFHRQRGTMRLRARQLRMSADLSIQEIKAHAAAPGNPAPYDGLVEVYEPAPEPASPEAVLAVRKAAVLDRLQSPPIAGWHWLAVRAAEAQMPEEILQM